MLTPTGWLIVILAAAIPATYGTMKARQVWLVHQAYVQGKRVGAEEVATKANAEALDVIRRQLEGERSAPKISPDRAKLIELCKRSASCRDRGQQ